MDTVTAVKMIKLTKELTIFVPCWWLIVMHVLVLTLLIGILFVTWFDGGEKLSCVLLSILTFAYYFSFMLPAKAPQYQWDIVVMHLWEITRIYCLFALIMLGGYCVFYSPGPEERIRFRLAFASCWGCIQGALGGTILALVVGG